MRHSLASFEQAIWLKWRRQIEACMQPSCIFCKIAARQLPGDIVFEDDEMIAFNDIGPQAPVHVLIIPKRHVSTVNELTDEDAALIGRLTLRARAIAAARGVAESGYRLILNCNAEGGQTVYHVHLHLLGGRQLRGLG
jgi:histidine triad (HIT) family protein